MERLQDTSAFAVMGKRLVVAVEDVANRRPGISRHRPGWGKPKKARRSVRALKHR